MLHPDQPAKVSYLEQVLSGVQGPFIAASDYVRALPEQLTQWIPGDYYVLGTDGMGRSETRQALRRHFEVDAESITIATLSRLSKTGLFVPEDVAKAIDELGFDPDKPNPYFA
jgi:pyruvate dehydrogenase E1 component